MRLAVIMEFCLLAALLFLAPTNAQLSEQEQNRLVDMATETLKGSDCVKKIAKSTEILAFMGQAPSADVSSQICRKVAKILIDEPSTLPSMVYRKAQIKSFLKCDILTEVGKEVDRILSVESAEEMEQLSIEELYYAYLLYS